TEVEQAWRRSRGTPQLRSPSRGIGRLYRATAVQNHAVVCEGRFATDETATYVQGHGARVALERIAPASAAPGAEVQSIARCHRNAIRFARHGPCLLVGGTLE